MGGWGWFTYNPATFRHCQLRPAVARPLRRSASVTTPNKSLDRTLLSGMGWNASGRWVGQLISWSSTLVVLRFLTPADYGLVAMGGTLFSLITLLGDGGMRGAIVNRQERSPAILHQLTSVSVLLGIAGMLVAMALAVPLAAFFREPRLTAVVLVVSASYAVLGFRVVPLAVLQRDLAFRTLAKNDLLMVTVTALTSVLVAWQGGGYWALIMAHVVGTTVATIAAWRAAPQALVRPVWTEVGDAVRFGGHLIVSSVATWFRGSADTVIIGRWIGQGVLGAYRVAMDFAALPLEKVAGIILQVTSPVFAAVRDDKAALSRYLLLLTEGLAMLTWPLATGLIVVADLAVPVVLGEQWSAAVVPLMIFSAAAMIRTVSPLLNTVVLARGHSRLIARVSIISAVVAVAAMIPATRWGVAGVAAAWALSFPMATVPILVVVLKDLEISYSRYAATLVPTVLACALEAVAVMALRQFDLFYDWSPVIQLVTCIAVGGIAYGIATALISRKRVRQVASLIRQRALPTVATAE